MKNTTPVAFIKILIYIIGVLNSFGNVVGLLVEQTVSILEIVDYHE